MFPIIKTALRILETPVTCSCERSFCVLHKLKMYSRSTMCKERLNAVALLYVNVDPNPQSILKKFVVLGLRRLEFGL